MWSTSRWSPSRFKMHTPIYFPFSFQTLVHSKVPANTNAQPNFFIFNLKSLRISFHIQDKLKLLFTAHKALCDTFPASLCRPLQYVLAITHCFIHIKPLIFSNHTMFFLSLLFHLPKFAASFPDLEYPYILFKIHCKGFLGNSHRRSPPRIVPFTSYFIFLGKLVHLLKGLCEDFYCSTNNTVLKGSIYNCSSIRWWALHWPGVCLSHLFSWSTWKIDGVVVVFSWICLVLSSLQPMAPPFSPPPLLFLDIWSYSFLSFLLFHSHKVWLLSMWLKITFLRPFLRYKYW